MSRLPLSGSGCPRCGSPDARSGPWPWYLGTIGAMIVRSVVCVQCGHNYDWNKPQADLAQRKFRLMIFINGVGCLGILAIIGSLVLFAMYLSR